MIHGRGIGVQRQTVRSVLSRDPRVVELADAPAGAGGWGATVVRLRRAQLDGVPPERGHRARVMPPGSEAGGTALRRLARRVRRRLLPPAV